MHKPFDRHPPSPYDPERYQRHQHHYHPQNPEPPHYHQFEDDPLARDTTKVTELKDRFGITRFKIALTDFDTADYPQNDDLQQWDTLFQVTVVSFCCKDETEAVILFEEQYSEYSKALIKFNELVNQYKMLINAETRGFQDITTFAERINFRVIDPDCCKNCIWGRPLLHKQQLFHDWKRHKKQMVCMNPKVLKIEEDYEPHDPITRNVDPRHPYHDRRYYDSEHFYHQERQHFDLDLSPYTPENGICDNYQRGTTNK